MTPLLTPPSSIWMSLKVVFLDYKKLIISEKHLKSALNPILEIRRAAVMWCTGSNPVPSLYIND